MIELLVTISVIALLMGILLPVLNNVREQAKIAVCLSNLRQLGVMFLAYTDDNNSFTINSSDRWLAAIKLDELNNKNLAYCPLATKSVTEGGQHPFAAFPLVPPLGSSAYYSANGNDIEIYGSYGINGWVCNPPSPAITIDGFERLIANNWRRINVKGANNIPLLLDSMWIYAYPDTNNLAPQRDGDIYGSGQSREEQMRFFCINRHDGFVNGVFLDLSARKIGLKELWKLKWHRNSDLNAPTPTWTPWMKNFKDY